MKPEPKCAHHRRKKLPADKLKSLKEIFKVKEKLVKVRFFKNTFSKLYRLNLKHSAQPALTKEYVKNNDPRNVEKIKAPSPPDF
jgi:hypothetical protein